MDPVVWISSLVGVIVVVFVVWLVLIETSIRVDPGTIALLLKRGEATSRALTPGRHFIQPWRKVMVQIYPSTELSFVAGGRPATDPRVEFVDEPLRVHLADKALAEISFTLRVQLDTSTLKDVHDQFGPEGLWTALRDTTRSCLIDEIASAAISVDDVFGDGFQAIEKRLTDALTKRLAATGFELRMFDLREVDLGETGEVIQATVRADAELARERALADVRRVRMENDAAMAELVVDGVDVMLRYRQVEAWRDILQRWDGNQPIPAALTVPLSAGTPPVDADEAHKEPEPTIDESSA